MAAGITWYDILGVLPDASVAEVRAGYDAKAGLLKPQFLAGAPATVLKAAARAQEILDAAWRALGDAARRAEYDKAAGIRRSGGGLAKPGSAPTDGWWPTDYDHVAGFAGDALLGGMMAVAGFLGPQPYQPRRIMVPDVRGLFFKECMQIVGALGFRLATVRLTERPLPVDGLVVGQSPAPQAKARRDSVLTVQVWHPPRIRP